MSILNEFFKKVKKETVKDEEISDLFILLDGMALTDSWAARKWYVKEIETVLRVLGISRGLKVNPDVALEVIKTKLKAYGN